MCWKQTLFWYLNHKVVKTTLPKDDFLVGIQTKFQCDMMKHFGEKLICMDATRGTNHYDFKLVTILVLDDFGEGVPVAWMISNKEDGATLKEFLRSLLLKTGPLQTMYFMSDDAEQYFFCLERDLWRRS